MSENLELRDGKWGPAVPMPSYGVLYVRCAGCRKRFWWFRRVNLRHGRYERHYRQAHLPPEVTG